jgi:hypothetical protein
MLASPSTTYAAGRSSRGLAGPPLQRLSELAQCSGTDLALGLRPLPRARGGGRGCRGRLREWEKPGRQTVAWETAPSRADELGTAALGL